MAGATRATPAEEGRHWISKLKERQLALELEYEFNPVTDYIAHNDGDFWITTSKTDVRRLGNLGWTQIHVIELIDNADRVEPMEIKEAPFGELIRHYP
jgi:hypothetical protein